MATDSKAPNVILMFKSSMAEESREKYSIMKYDPQTRTIEYANKDIYYERESDGEIVKVTCVISILPQESVKQRAQKYIQESHFPDLEFIGIARRWVPNYQITDAN
tara:strand:- start:689 stop:1006 length:318 start_codon:yes stop_codon:yes gene_type:complete